MSQVRLQWPVVLFLFVVACVAEQPAAVDYTANTKLKVDAGTQADADAALKTANEFLVLWNDGKVEQAAELVEPRLRPPMLAEMKRKVIKLQSIDEVRVFSGTKNAILGRVRFARDPGPQRPDLKKQETMIDMILIDGKWWITAR